MDDQFSSLGHDLASLLDETANTSIDQVADEEACNTASVPCYISTGQFTMNEDGLTTEVERGRGDNAWTETVLISGPFEVLGRVRDPMGHGWAKLICWKDADGRRHEYPVPDAALHGDLGALVAELASRGLTVSRGAHKHLADYLVEVDVSQRLTMVNRTGWHTIGEKPVFVLPEQVIGSPASETVILTGAAGSPYASQGTLDDWKERVGLLTCGHGRLVLAVSTGFAGPLLALLEAEGGGINLYGMSSRGKTTALKAAASVWGRGAADPGFVRSWRATANAQEATAAIVSDTLLCLDEIGVAESRDAAAAVYQLASGVGKGRSARDGSLRVPMTWRVMTLSTGEMPMAVKVAQDRQRRAYAGQSVRLLDIPADAGRGFGIFDSAGEYDDAGKLAEAIQQAAVTSYGTAGPAFVEALASRDPAEVTLQVEDAVAQFEADHLPPGADGQVRRATGRFGLVAAAGEMARGWNRAVGRG